MTLHPFTVNREDGNACLHPYGGRKPPVIGTRVARGNFPAWYAQKPDPSISVELMVRQEVFGQHRIRNGEGIRIVSPRDAPRWLAAGWLLRWGSERLAFLRDQEDEHFSGSRGTRVLRIMDDLSGVMEYFTRLVGLRLLPLRL